MRMVLTMGFWLALSAAFPIGAATPTLPQRNDAAGATANGAAACVAITPFYWEIGDPIQTRVSGSVGNDAPTRDTLMPIASASKWIYAAYVAEREHGHLTAADVHFLTFESGYTRFRVCRVDETVASCAQSVINGAGQKDRLTENRFFYSGGHMQQHAVDIGLGRLDAGALSAEIQNGLKVLGSDWTFRYSQPQLAGGGVATAGSYATFLQGMLSGKLELAQLLGTHPVCTNPLSCPGEALKSPIPASESWHYSLGHWVEDDPRAGDGSFSSPGAFGFYPWISRDKQSYGVIARLERRRQRNGEPDKPGVNSMVCGRLIRAAWLDGTPRR